MPPYIPEKGDFVILTFDPQSGHEQQGRRPALVISNRLFNKHTGLALVCPLTIRSIRLPTPCFLPSASSLGSTVPSRDKYLCKSIGT